MIHRDRSTLIWGDQEQRDCVSTVCIKETHLEQKTSWFYLLLESIQSFKDVRSVRTVLYALNKIPSVMDILYFIRNICNIVFILALFSIFQLWRSKSEVRNWLSFIEDWFFFLFIIIILIIKHYSKQSIVKPWQSRANLVYAEWLKKKEKEKGGSDIVSRLFFNFILLHLSCLIDYSDVIITVMTYSTQMYATCSLIYWIRIKLACITLVKSIEIIPTMQ